MGLIVLTRLLLRWWWCLLVGVGAVGGWVRGRRRGLGLDRRTVRGRVVSFGNDQGSARDGGNGIPLFRCSDTRTPIHPFLHPWVVPS